MTQGQIYPLHPSSQFRKAGSTDLIELMAVPKGHPLFIPKWVLETVASAIVSHECIHLSGPTGSAKTSLLEALYRVPENFLTLCAALGLPGKPLKLYPVEMAIFETPGEVLQRRALRDGCTYDEASPLVRALRAIAEDQEECHPLVWLREIGRVHSPVVQGGLLNLMSPGDIILPDGERLDGSAVSWVADSNYQAQADSTYLLAAFDDALRRRFSVNVTLDYLPLELEIQVMGRLLGKESAQRAEAIRELVSFSHAIRRQRAEGNMRSVTPPTIAGYLSYFRMEKALPHFSRRQLLMVTLLGNATSEDRERIPGLLSEMEASSANEGEVLEGRLF